MCNATRSRVRTPLWLVRVPKAVSLAAQHMLNHGTGAHRRSSFVCVIHTVAQELIKYGFVPLPQDRDRYDADLPKGRPRLVLGVQYPLVG